MRPTSAITAAVALAVSIQLGACHEGPDAELTDPSPPAGTVAAVARGQAAGSPRERAVLAAMEQYKQAILDRDTAGKMYRRLLAYIAPSIRPDKPNDETSRQSSTSLSRFRDSLHPARGRPHGNCAGVQSI
jgi:hypothetical protein